MQAYVLTGFLGVGKTTMMKRTITNYFQNKNVAVIVNEFGDIGIDGTILKNVYSEVLEISEGCICCKLAQEFESGVIEIMEKYNPDILFVETSGASEPFPIFLSLQNLGISVEGVICMIDTLNFDKYKENSTAKYQIGGSNILLLNKTDIASADQIKAVKKEVIEIKEQYDIKNILTQEKIFKHYNIYESQNGDVDSTVFEGNFRIADLQLIAKEYAHNNHTSSDKLAQQIVYVKAIEFNTFDKFLQGIPKQVIRIKGIVKLLDIENALVVNNSFGNITYEEIENYSESSMLIFIGTDVASVINQLIQQYDFLYLPQFTVAP